MEGAAKNFSLHDLVDFRQAARQWLKIQTFPVIPTEQHARLAALCDWQRHLLAHGWMGLSWPKQYGGQGLTLLHQAVFNQELAKAGAPSPIGSGAIDVIGPTILAFGSEEQKTTLLPNMLSAKQLWAQGFSEPNSGSDLASLATVAEKVPGGYRINGRKIWSTRGHLADWIALLARTDRNAPPHKGISYLLLRLNTSGISARPIEQLNGEADFAEIAFVDVFVPDDALMGELNKGWSYAMHTLAFERGCYVLRRVTDLTVDFRLALDELDPRSGTLNDSELRQIGELDADLYSFESQARPIAARLAQGPKAGDVTDSLDKMALAGFEQKLARFWRDLLGPYAAVTDRRPRGLDADRLIQRYYWSRASSIYGGTTQIQRNIVAERMLGLPREGTR
jgi:alkylation response protein AidB-like acyl-CoA dehydrogenase